LGMKRWASWGGVPLRSKVRNHQVAVFEAEEEGRERQVRKVRWAARGGEYGLPAIRAPAGTNQKLNVSHEMNERAGRKRLLQKKKKVWGGTGEKLVYSVTVRGGEMGGGRGGRKEGENGVTLGRGYSRGLGESYWQYRNCLSRDSAVKRGGRRRRGWYNEKRQGPSLLPARRHKRRRISRKGSGLRSEKNGSE